VLLYHFILDYVKKNEKNNPEKDLRDLSVPDGLWSKKDGLITPRTKAAAI